MKFITLLPAIIGLLVASGEATHKLGSSCSGKDIGTYGCSDDECTVIKCSTSGNGNYYWELAESCISMKCENGACNAAYPKDSCTA
ncbi:hypothetical protein AAFC00_003355 [Neodothiora populina]